MVPSAVTVKTEAMMIVRPVLLKAGIPLVLSMAGFLCARIVTRRSRARVANCSTQNHADATAASEVKCIRDSAPRDEESSHGLISICSIDSARDEDDQEIITSPRLLSSNSWNKSYAHGESLLVLRSMINELQEREWKLEMQFLRYCDLREQESALMEIGNLLQLGMAHLEYLNREISSVEEENQTITDLATEYLKVVEELHHRKSENARLQRKVNKLSGRVKLQSRILRERTLKIEKKQIEISKSRVALESKTRAIKKMEDEIKELKEVLDQLKQEKHELLTKLDMAEKAAASAAKADEDHTSLEDVNHLVKDLEQLQVVRTAEEKELIYLRWSNACLRHELIKNSVQERGVVKAHSLELALAEEGNVEDHYDSEHDLRKSNSSNDSLSCGIRSHKLASSKSTRILRKIKKWVEGNDKGKAKEAERNGKHGLGYLKVQDEQMVEASRGSCSST